MGWYWVHERMEALFLLTHFTKSNRRVGFAPTNWLTVHQCAHNRLWWYATVFPSANIKAPSNFEFNCYFHLWIVLPISSCFWYFSLSWAFPVCPSPLSVCAAGHGWPLPLCSSAHLFFLCRPASNQATYKNSCSAFNTPQIVPPEEFLYHGTYWVSEDKRKKFLPDVSWRVGSLQQCIQSIWCTCAADAEGSSLQTFI